MSPRTLALALVLATPALAAAGTGLSLRAGLAYWQPRAEARDLADVSPALRAEVAYAITPWLAAMAAGDWVVVDKAADLVAGDVYYYAGSIGLNVTYPVRGRVRPVLGVSLGRYSVHADCLPAVCGGALVNDSALGERLDIGVSLRLHPRVQAQATLGYSHARLDLGRYERDVRDVDALVLDLGLGLTL